MELSSLQQMARAIARTHAAHHRGDHDYLRGCEDPAWEPHAWVVDAVHQALMMSPQHVPAEEVGYQPPSSAWREKCAQSTPENRTTFQWARRATAIGGVPVADHFEMVPVEVPPTPAWRAGENLAERIARKQVSETYVQRKGTRDPSVVSIGSEGAHLRYDESFPLDERFADQVVAELVRGDLKVERIVLTPHRVSVDIAVESIAREEIAKTSAKVHAAFDSAHANAKSTFEGKLEQLAEAAFWHYDKVTKEGIPVPMPPGETPTVRSVDARDQFKAEIRHVARSLRSLMTPADPADPSKDGGLVARIPGGIFTIFRSGSGEWAIFADAWCHALEGMRADASDVIECDVDAPEAYKLLKGTAPRALRTDPTTVFCIGGRWWWTRGTWAGAPDGWMKRSEVVIETAAEGVMVIKDRMLGHHIAKHINRAPPLKELDREALVAIAPASAGGLAGTGIAGTVIAGTPVHDAAPATIPNSVVVMGVARADINRGQRIKLHTNSGDVEPHDVDDVRLAAELAADNFDRDRKRENRRGNDRVFNAAGFSSSFCKLAKVAGPLDGNVVRAMMRGRADIVELEGGAHFRIREGS